MVRVLREHPGRDELFYRLLICARVIQSFLGLDWWHQHVFPATERTEFYEWSRTDDLAERISYSRVYRLAASIYDLRHATGFRAWAPRLNDKDLDAAFYEACVAGFLHKHGHLVSFSPRTGIKGADFDFRSAFGGVEFCVEVKSKKAETPLRHEPIYDTLRQACKSLPKDYRNLIVLFIPHTWAVNAAVAPTLDGAIAELFRSSQRINYILVYWFEHILLPTDALMSSSKWRAYKNSHARLSYAPAQPPLSRDVAPGTPSALSQQLQRVCAEVHGL
jgi:hypothetical protein